MVLLGLVIFAVMAFFIANNSNRNKYINIIVMFLISACMIIIVGLLYKARAVQYNFPLNFDYILFKLIKNIRLNIRDLSRVYNISFALYMLCGAICIKALNVGKNRCVFGIMLAGIAFFLIYNDPRTVKEIYYIKIYNGSVFTVRLFDALDKINKAVVYSYIILPQIFFVLYYRSTKIFAKKKDILVYGCCVFIINLFVWYICFVTVYRDILFWNVDVAGLPTVHTEFRRYTSIPFVTLGIIGILVLLIVYFQPFNTVAVITRRSNRQSKKEMQKDFAMILHTYKNSFIGLKRVFNFACDNIHNGDYDKAEENLKLGLSVADDNLDSVIKIINSLRFMEDKYTKVCITDCIKDALVSLNADKYAKIVFADEDKKIYVWGNYQKLTEVFRNVIQNAIEAKKPNNDNHRIEIVLTDEDDAAEIDITDNGEGIPKKDIKKVFKMFYSTKGNFNNGVGFAFVTKQLKNHNGEIRVKSKVGEYTTVQMALPVYREKKRFFK